MFYKYFKKHNALIFTVIFIFFLLSSCTEHTALTAQNGIVDLRNWNFNSQGTVELNGQWLFYPECFVPPESLSRENSKTDLPEPIPVQVPSSWGKDYKYGTYFLTLLLPENLPSRHISLKIRSIISSYRLYAGNREIASAGIPSDIKGISVPEVKPLIANLPSGTNRINLVFHVSNYFHRKSGIIEPVTIGLRSRLQLEEERSNIVLIFVVGTILMMGVYHFILYFLNRKSKAALYYAFLCLLMTLRALIINDLYIYTLFPHLSWRWQVNLEYLTFYLGVTASLLFLKAMFPKYFPAGFIRYTTGISLTFAVLTIIFPVKTASYLIPVYQINTLILVSAAAVFMTRAIIDKRENSLLLTIGFVPLFILTVLEILSSNNLISGSPNLIWGMQFSLVFQSLVLAREYFKNIKRLELQSIVLKREIKKSSGLNKELIKSKHIVEESRLGIILGLAKLAEYRDKDTGTHLERIRSYSRLLAGKLSENIKYNDYITNEYIKDLFQSSILHDIGKVGIPDAILLKPAKLTKEEFELIKEHPSIGYVTIVNIENRINHPSFLSLGKEIARSHHERWDGKGYPDGLSGENIPLSARIVALADVYDALTSKRPYKKAFSHKEAVSIILEGKETQFDPDIINAFTELTEEFNRIRINLQENNTEDHENKT